MSTQTETKPQARELRVVEDKSAVSFLMDTARFEHLQRVSLVLANAGFTPKHLKGSTKDETLANCFRVVNQAMRWQFDPFAVADETYVVHGRLGYQGKLVAAVINARAGLEGRLSANYEGKGPDRTVTISGKFAEEDKARTITLSVAQAKTENAMWDKDPDQKLWYSGVIKWARRHCPEVIMGVLTDDDLERIPSQEMAPPLGTHSLSSIPNGSRFSPGIPPVPTPDQPDPDLARRNAARDELDRTAEQAREQASLEAKDLHDRLSDAINETTTAEGLGAIEADIKTNTGILGERATGLLERIREKVKASGKRSRAAAI